MISLLYGIGFFVLYGATAVLYLRRKRSGPRLRMLAGFAGLWLGLFGVILRAFPEWCVWNRLDPRTILGVPLPGSALLLYGMLTLWLMVVWNMAEYESPSMEIMRRIDRHPKAEMSREDLLREMTDDALVGIRLRELAESGYVTFDGVRYGLSPAGRWVARIFSLYRRCLGRGWGG